MSEIKPSGVVRRPRTGGRPFAAAFLLVLGALTLGACTTGSTGEAPVAPSASAALSAVASAPPSAAPASDEPVVGAPCRSAADPAQMCGGDPASPPGSRAVPSPVSGAAEASPAPSPVPVESAPAGSTAPVSSPVPASGKPATSSASTVVTVTDDGSTLHLAVGERFQLDLGSGTEWTVKVADPGVVAPVVGVTLASGVQGLYVARAAGTTVLSAVGQAACASGPCPQFRIGFTLTITVG